MIGFCNCENTGSALYTNTVQSKAEMWQKKKGIPTIRDSAISKIANSENPLISTELCYSVQLLLELWI